MEAMNFDNPSGGTPIRVGTIALGSDGAQVIEELTQQIRAAAQNKRSHEIEEASQQPVGVIIERLYSVLDHFQSTAEGLAAVPDTNRTELGSLFKTSIDQGYRMIQEVIVWIENNVPFDGDDFACACGADGGCGDDCDCNSTIRIIGTEDDASRVRPDDEGHL